MVTHVRITRGIRWKLLSTMIGLIVALLATLTFVHTLGQTELMQRELERRVELQKGILRERGRTLADNLRRQAENNIAAFNFSNLSEAMNSAVREHTDLKYAVLMDVNRTAFIHTRRPELIQEKLDGPEDVYAARQTAATVQEYGREAAAVMEFIEPLHLNRKSVV